MTGRQFEETLLTVLFKKGYWAHRIAPDESGQQPFDIIAIKKGEICVYDAKVVSQGFNFPLSRIEINQFNSFSVFHKWVPDAKEIGCLILCAGEVRLLSFEAIVQAIRENKRSIDVRTLPIWRFN